MVCLRFLILPLFLGLSMGGVVFSAQAADKPAKNSQNRCVTMRLDRPAPQAIGYAMKRMKQSNDEIDNRNVTIQPLMAGLRGPRLSAPGRDVRLAVTTRQSSPQEIWHKGTWNAGALVPCAPSKRPFYKKILNGLYWKTVFDNEIGLTTYQPKILYRSRAVLDGMIVAPKGFTLGAALSLPLATNTEALLQLNDTRTPVRRDMARFANALGLERLYASWRTTPITDMHVAISAGWLEEMYGGGGLEIIWRPFGSPYWAGADAWHLWRRDNTHVFNSAWTNTQANTGHLRMGYDMPDTRFGASLAIGQYLAGDRGATLALTQGFDNGMRLDAALTWTGRTESEGFFKNAKLDPSVRLTLPLGKTKHKEMRTQFKQLGRDGGQMLNRPLPLETLTEAFSTREYIRHWGDMLK